MTKQSEMFKSPNCLGSYEDLIRAFISSGYQTAAFSSIIKPERQLILRHDIDFDCSLAGEIAAIEYKLGVDATYFFLLSSDSYNLISKRNIETVLKIKEKGHQVSLHFDPLVYGENFLEGFRYEKEIFEKTFKTKIEIISIHRPNDFFLNYDKKIDGVEHTYQNKFFREIKYISDSQGLFRFGHPLESEEFKRKKTIHLLIHPIWWIGNGDSNISILNNYIEKQKSFLHSHVGENCLPYREYLNKK